MKFLIGFAIVFAIAVLLLIRAARKAGRPQLPDEILAAAQSVIRVTAQSQGGGWQRLGSMTTARGLDLKFDADDDPQAEAMIPVPDLDPDIGRNSLANRVTITLTDRHETHHVHTGGFVFRVRLRGTGNVVGRQVLLKMVIHPRSGSPIGGMLENDDDIDAAVGDWIEVESAEILRVSR